MKTVFIFMYELKKQHRSSAVLDKLFLLNLAFV